jgi:DNA polymerase III delta prime subunit
MIKSKIQKNSKQSLRKIYNFEDLEKKFLNELSTKKFHHATIINSPKSSGKFSFIKNFLTSYQDKDFDSNLNVLSISKTDKNYIGVDKIRKINEFLKLTAVTNEQRFIIIDAIDDLNKNASNALLKNLEEPPENVYFILISYNLENINDTIKSRCRLLLAKNPNFNEFCQIFIENDFDLNEENLKILFDLTSGSVGQALLYIKHDIYSIYNEIYSISHLRDIDFSLVKKISDDIDWYIFQKITILILNKKINFLSQKGVSLGVFFIIKDKIIYIIDRLDKSYLNKEHCVINVLNLLIKLNSTML